MPFMFQYLCFQFLKITDLPPNFSKLPGSYQVNMENEKVEIQ